MKKTLLTLIALVGLTSFAFGQGGVGPGGARYFDFKNGVADFGSAGQEIGTGSSTLTAPVVIQTGDGALPITTSTVVVTKGSAAALTLAAPGVNGVVLTVTSGTAFAHVITATGLLNDGLTGAPHNTFTFGGFAGNSVTYVSYNGLWNQISKN